VLQRCLVALPLFLSACGAGANVPNVAFDPAPRPVLAQTTRSSAGAQMFFTPSGHLYLLGGTSSGGHTALNVYVSKDDGDSFQQRIPAAPASSDAMTMGEMSPVLLQDPAGPSMDLLYQGGNGKLYFAKSYLFAKHFPPAIDLVKKAVPSENGFATMALSPSGALYVAWLDGRASDRNPPNTFSLYVARSIDHGKSFQEPVKVDGGTCPCCRPAFAFGADGTVYVAWRKDYAGNLRDIVVASSKDGRSFSSPLRVSKDGWSLDGCPDSGPTLKTVGSRLYVVWYTQGTANVPEIRSAYTDDMRTFSSPVPLSHDVLDANHPKFVVGSRAPMVVFQGRPSSEGPWAPVRTFLVSLDGSSVSAPLALPKASASVEDPIGVMRDAQSLFVAANTAVGANPQIVVTRGRLQTKDRNQ
jgi:nitrous oxide reductase accessory protein NosL